MGYLDSFGPNVDALAESERAKYTECFNNPRYRETNQGLQLWQLHREIFPQAPRYAVDIGCGTGELLTQWIAEGIDAYGIDLIENGLATDNPHRDRVEIACLWGAWMPSFARYCIGVCADVMEHIPPDKVDAVLANICPLSDITIFQIANYPSNIRHDLHLSLHDAAWWQRKLEQYGVVERLHVAREGVREYIFSLTAYDH